MDSLWDDSPVELAIIQYTLRGAGTKYMPIPGKTVAKHSCYDSFLYDPLQLMPNYVYAAKNYLEQLKIGIWMRLIIGFFAAFALFLRTDASPLAEDGRDPIIAFAAASLTTVLDEQARHWRALTGAPFPRLSFGASGTMARQIQAGAPANLFISANPHWTNMLVRSGHASKLANIAENRLVLVAPENAATPTNFNASRDDFTRLLKARRLALADPALAPAGAYAKAFLQKTGLWEHLKDQVAYAQNVRQALRLAERGSLPAFVYASDAATSARVRILYTVPTDLTEPIRYEAALINSTNTDADAFLAYLQSPDAVTVWEKHGFRKIASN